MIRSINPATGEPIREYEEPLEAVVTRRIETAAAAQDNWKRVPVSRRAAMLEAVAELLETRLDRYATLMTTEMGKIIREARAEIEKCAWVCRYYAEHAEQFLSPEPVETDASRSAVVFRPLGVILAVMPWNFPFWQVFRFAAPGLAAGNAAVLKHASNVPGCALAIEELFADAGYPEGLFAALLIPGSRVEQVISHPEVRGVTLTGSTAAGAAVAGTAGARLKKTVLELGGSDPYLILEDADLENAVETCVTARMINGGQSCIAAKRFVVVEPVREAFQEAVLQRMDAIETGDPRREDTRLGPMATAGLRDDLHDQVRRSIDAGAACLVGGEVPEGDGAWYPATVLAGVKPGMAAFDEELFGPVATIVPVADEAEAIRVANQSSFGLGAAVFTRDRVRGERIATEELEAGCCFVNTFVRSDPRLPFGGVKQSGYGRELSRHGMLEFVNTKTVYVA